MNAAATHAYSNNSCAVCHQTEPAKPSTCTNCHSYAWAAAHSGYQYEGDFYHGALAGDGTDYLDMGFYSTGWLLPPYTRGNAALPCTTCHDKVGTRNYYNFPNVVNGVPVTVTTGQQYVNLCVACHGGTVDQWHAGCFDCHLAGHGSTPGWTLQGRDCSLCHGHGANGWQHHDGWTPGPTL
jgi:hypothetical protein